MILAGDIGGTNSRLAFFSEHGGRGFHRPIVLQLPHQIELIRLFDRPRRLGQERSRLEQ